MSSRRGFSESTGVPLIGRQQPRLAARAANSGRADMQRVHRPRAVVAVAAVSFPLYTLASGAIAEAIETGMLSSEPARETGFGVVFSRRDTGISSGARELQLFRTCFEAMSAVFFSFG